MTLTNHRAQLLDLACIRERLLQAKDLTQTAASLLAQLNLVVQDDAFKYIIKLTTEASGTCYEALHRIDGQIARMPLP